MTGVNKVIIIGNLGNDPDMRYMPNGDAVANISVATSETWTDKKTGEKREKTEWTKVVAFRKLGEVIGQYCKKGSKVYIEGKLQTRKWTDKQGVDHYTTEVIADQMQMLDSKGGQQAQSAPPPQNRPQQSQTNTYAQASGGNAQANDGFTDSEIPF